MCGIVGFIDKQQAKEKTIRKMAKKIEHRGPDAEGYYIDEYIALGHKRLSIIDIKNGKQPMLNEEENLITIFNGEIYNYSKLKEELIKKRTHF